jgi:hypothetical protein
VRGSHWSNFSLSSNAFMLAFMLACDSNIAGATWTPPMLILFPREDLTPVETAWSWTRERIVCTKSTSFVPKASTETRQARAKKTMYGIQILETQPFPFCFLTSARKNPSPAARIVSVETSAQEYEHARVRARRTHTLARARAHKNATDDIPELQGDFENEQALSLQKDNEKFPR